MKSRIGRYEIVRPLGSSDRVFLAQTGGFGGFARHVVVKTFELVGGAEGPFIEEVQHLGRLHHQHITPVLEAGRDGETFWVALDFVHGRSAREVWERTFTLGALLPGDFALTVVAAAASALHFAHTRQATDGHSLGILHGHVSLSNVLIGFDGSVQLIGFAGAAARGQRASATQLGFAKDQLAYLAPEQVRRQPLDPRADIFGLGVLLYELTTMRRAFRDDSDRLTLERIKSGSYVSPRSILDDYPPELERIVARALQLDPAARYPSAEAMRRELVALGHHFEMVLGDAAVVEVMTQLFDDESRDPWLPPLAEAPEPTPVPVGEAGARRRPLRAATETVDALAIELEIPIESLAGGGERVATDLDTKATSEVPSIRNDTVPGIASPAGPSDTVSVPALTSAPVSNDTDGLPVVTTVPVRNDTDGVPVVTTVPVKPVRNDTDGVPVVPAPTTRAVEPPRPSPKALPSKRARFQLDRRIILIGSAGVVAVVVITTVVALALRGTDRASSTVATGAPGDAAPVDAAPRVDAPAPMAVSIDAALDAAPVDAAVAAKVRIRITSTPPNATVVLDNKRLGKTPFDGMVDRAEGAHVLKLRLHGFTGARRDVDLTTDVTEDIRLDPIPAADAGAADEPEPRSPSELEIPD